MFRIIGPGGHRQNRGRLARMFALRAAITTAAGPGVTARLLPEAGRDRFDTDETVYVLTEEAGVLRGCVRLNPTTSPHMMGAFLPSLCDLRPLPAGPGVWECSRLVIDTLGVPDRLEQFQLRCQLGLGVVAWCLDEDIRQLIWLIHESIFRQMSEIFRTDALGRPADLPDGSGWIPAVSDIDLQALDKLIGRLRIAPEIVGDLIAAGLGWNGGFVA